MNKEQLKHIFEDSACLTPRQIKGYVTGKMVHEEAHAVEVHLLSCPFCSDAVEAMTEHKTQGAVNVMEKLDAGFIAKHLGVTTQEINIAKNTPPVIKAGSYSTAPEKEKPKTVRKLWKPMALAASLLAVVAVLWFMRDTIFPQDAEQLVQTTPVEKKQEPEIAYRPALDTNAVAYTDTIATTIPQTIVDEATVAMAEDATSSTVKDLKDAGVTREAEKKAADTKPMKDLSAGKAKADEPVVAATRQPTVDVLPRMGNSYAPPEVPAAKIAATEEQAESTESARKSKDVARTGIEKADDLYNSGKYRRALKIYQDEMGDTRSNKRDAATYMAAKCHIELGEKMQARTLLNSLVNENSVKKGQAQQLLNQLGDE